MKPNTQGPSTAHQVENSLAGSRLRILIVGAGIAGTTLAALLKRQGERPAIIERQGREEAEGYMLGLLPLGGRVLNALDLKEEYNALSVSMKNYQIFNRRGEKPKDYPLAQIIDTYGDWRGISRANLLAAIRSRCGDVIHNSTIHDVTQNDDEVIVEFQDGSKVSADLVVGAEGAHSSIRQLLWSKSEVENYDSGWGGYVVWSAAKGLPLDTYSELWSAGWGIGIYPVSRKIGVFLGGSNTQLATMSPTEFFAHIRDKVPSHSPFAKALDQSNINEDSFLWPMTDVRVRSSWSKKRVVLVGDAAASFLPTAGIGASAAMDSAATLADEISRADADRLPYAMSLYEKRQRPKVEKAQKSSRKLAKMMFLNSNMAVAMRDAAMKYYSLDAIVRDLSKIMEGD